MAGIGIGTTINDVRYMKGHTGGAFRAKFNSEGTYCLTCGQDRTIRLWNPHRPGIEDEKSALLIKTYSGVHGYDVQDVAIANDNNTFASCGRDKQVFVWDVSTARVIRKLHDHEQRVNALCYNYSGSVLATASYDNTVRFWDMRAHNSYRPIQVLDEFQDSVTCVVVSEHQVIAGSVDGCVRTFDLRTGKVLIDTVHHPVGSVSISSDKNCILVSCLDGKLRLLDALNGKLLNEYSGHQNTSFSIQSCFSNSDGQILSGSEDGRVYIWDLLSNMVLKSFQAHSKATCSIAYHPSQDLLLTASYDGTAKIWSTSTSG